MKQIAILAEDLYQEMELYYPLYRLREAGYDVFVIGSGEKDEFQSKLGYPVKVDLDACGANPDDFSCVIIPGGFAPDRMRRYPEMVDFVRKVWENGGIVGAICHGGWMLVSADVLRGKKATCFFAIKDDLVNAGAEYLDKEVVVDGNLITSRVPDDLPFFLKAIINALEN